MLLIRCLLWWTLLVHARWANRLLVWKLPRRSEALTWRTIELPRRTISRWGRPTKVHAVAGHSTRLSRKAMRSTWRIESRGLLELSGRRSWVAKLLWRAWVWRRPAELPGLLLLRLLLMLCLRLWL